MPTSSTAPKGKIPAADKMGEIGHRAREGRGGGPEKLSKAVSFSRSHAQRLVPDHAPTGPM